MMNAASSINLSEESEHRQDHPSPSTLPLHHLSISAQSEGVKDSNDNDNKDVDLDKDCVQKAPPSEEVAKLASAATLIQSVYRGYQSRRELYGSALTASQKWRFLIDYSRIQHIHKMDAKDKDHLPQSPSLMIPDDPNQHPSSSSQAPNESRARWAWRRAEFLGSRLGKTAMLSEPPGHSIATPTESTSTAASLGVDGSRNISTEEALVLLTEHWLEMSDKKHRYGSNLKPYHEYWLKQETSQNFFYWLDKGDGKDVNLEERPRDRLDQQRVQYLLENERLQYAVHVVDGLLYYKISDKPVHTLPASVLANDDVDVSQVLPDSNENDDEATRLEKKRIRNKSKFIYVTDPQGTLYVAQKVKGNFHHSSFLGGGTVCAAGGIIVNHGKLVKINPKSGHYRPGQRHFDKLLMNLKEMGISMDGVKVSYGILEAEGESGAVGGGQETSGNRLEAPLYKMDVKVETDEAR